MSVDQTNRRPTDTDAQMRLRDAVMMDLSRVTDLNTAELSRLTIRDVNLDAGCLQVHGSTGTRAIMLGPVTRTRLRQYIRYFRPEIGPCKDDDALFISVIDGEPMTPTHIRKTIEHHNRQKGRQHAPNP